MLMENEDNINNNEKNKNIEVVIGDSSNLSFSNVNDFMGDLKPQNTKGSKKNIIIPTNKVIDKEDKTEKPNEETESNQDINNDNTNSNENNNSNIDEKEKNNDDNNSNKEE